MTLEELKNQVMFRTGNDAADLGDFLPHVVDYLNAVRIRHACRLLEQTNLGVSQVSQLTGFNSVVYFDRQFRRFTGQTPTAYTAQHRF